MNIELLKEYISLILIEGKGDLLFQKFYSLVLEAAKDVRLFEYFSGRDHLDGYGGSLDSRRGPYWARSWGKQVSKQTLIQGGYFKDTPALAEKVKEIYEALSEQYGDEVVANHWGSDPAFMYVWMTSIGIWSYSSAAAGNAIGVQAGEMSRPSANWAGVKNTPFGYVPTGHSPGLSINTKDSNINKTNQQGWVNSQIRGYNTTHVHEYRHAYQSIFVIPKKLKKASNSEAEAKKFSKAYFGDQARRSFNQIKNNQLPDGVERIFSQIFSAEETSPPSKGRGKRRVTYEPGQAFYVISRGDGTRRRDRYQNGIKQKILNGLLDMAEEGSTEAKRMLKSFGSEQARRSRARAAGYQYGRPEFRIDDETKKRLEDIFPNKELYRDYRLTFPYGISEDEEARKALPRGSRLFYITPSISMNVQTRKDQYGEEFTARTTPKPLRQDRGIDFRNLRGLDNLDARINLGGRDANSGEKWTNQPTEFDADLIAHMNDGLKRIAKGTDYDDRIIAHEWINFALDGDSEKLNKSVFDWLRGRLSRFIGGWGGTNSKRHREYYEKTLKSRTRALGNAILEWVDDNWPEDFDPGSLRDRQRNRYSFAQEKEDKMLKLVKKMVENIT